MTSKSGFTADIIFAEQGTSRMDAAWDVSGNLNGQILNPLGEDLLNFKIDSTGVLQTDVSIKQSEVLGTSLEFLAQLGTRRTRELLCSGLFLSTADQHVRNFVQENSETEFNLATSGTQWHIQSGIYPVVHESRNANEELKIITHVSTGDWIFRQSIATIEWQGKVIGRYMRPQFLSIHSSRSSIRLSFLDFE